MENNDEEQSNHPACAACKHQKKRCKSDCILIQHFPANRAKDFNAVKQVFGIKSLTKMISDVKPHQRGELVKSINWEASIWEKDPVHGPYGYFKKVEDELNCYKINQQYLQPLQHMPVPVNQEINNGLVIPRQINSIHSFDGNYMPYHAVNRERMSLQGSQSRALMNQQAGRNPMSIYSPNVNIQINNNNNLLTDQSIYNGELIRRQMNGDFASGSNGLNHAANHGQQQNYTNFRYHNNILPDKCEEN